MAPNPSSIGGPAPLGPEDAALATVVAELERHQGPPPADQLWIGDDAAVVSPPPGPLVLATDAVVAGVHADLAVSSLDDLGWKAVTVTISDLAAMGARPLYALVTYCQPKGIDVGLLTRGVGQAAAQWRCPVVGGDLSAATQLMVSVAAVGTVDRTSSGEPGPVTRGGAQPGDAVALSGPLGSSAAGLRLLHQSVSAPGEPDAPRRTVLESPGAQDLVEAHRRPRARLVEGWVARQAGATAMIDISDGLALDLHRLAATSGVGLRLEGIPVAAGATPEEALSGGEDYELVITAPDLEVLRRRFAEAGLRPPLEIGRCTEDPTERRLAGAPFAPAGWQHSI